jgi:hypothetical protein
MQSIVALSSCEAECIALVECIKEHIDTRHHFIRQAVQKGYIKLQYIKTDENIADVLTKFTKKSTFEAQTQKLLSKN